METNDTPAPLSAAELDELVRLEKAATPGPWEWARFESPEGGEDGVHCPQDPTAYTKPDGTWHALTVCRGMTGPRRSENAQFISAMRNHLKPLIARLRAAERERDELKAFKAAAMDDETTHFCANGCVWRKYPRVMCSMCANVMDPVNPLEAENARLFTMVADATTNLTIKDDAIQRLGEENARLRSALEPFAKMCQMWDEVCGEDRLGQPELINAHIQYEHLRRAAAAIARGEGGEK